MSKHQLNKVVEHLLKSNAIAFDKIELAFQIQSHPSYPSLHAITGVLDHFNIENVAADVPVRQETLDQLPETFVAQIGTETGQELCTVTKKEKKCSIVFASRKKERLSRDEFLQRFTGIIVAVDKTKKSSSAIASNGLLNQVLGVVIAALLIVIFMRSPLSTEASIFVSLSIIGVVIGVVILKQELGLQTTLGNAFCSGTSKQKDCDAVITSEGSNLLGGFKFSDLGLIYFISITFLSLLFSIQGKPIDSLLLFSFLSLPVISYSIYYQAFVVRKWCILCLGVVAVLVLQIVASLAFLEGWFIPTWGDLLITSLVFLSVFGIWSYLKPRYKQLQAGEKTRIEYLKFKRDFSLFSTLLNQSDSLDTHIPNTKEIILGNSESNLGITVITNPFCGHCKSVHTLVEDVLHKYHQYVSITIRFNINTNDAESELVKITSRLIEIYVEEGEQACLHAMSEIYDKASPKEWLAKWFVSIENRSYLQVLEQAREWCHGNQINFTPEILINGKPFPKAYEKGDLIYFIEELHEQSVSAREAPVSTAYQEINH